MAYFVAFSSSTSGATSTGYCPGKWENLYLAEMEIRRLENQKYDAKDVVRTVYRVMGPGGHECSVPGWSAGCRQCKEESMQAMWRHKNRYKIAKKEEKTRRKDMRWAEEKRRKEATKENGYINIWVAYSPWKPNFVLWGGGSRNARPLEEARKRAESYRGRLLSFGGTQYRVYGAPAKKYLAGEYDSQGSGGWTFRNIPNDWVLLIEFTQ